MPSKMKHFSIDDASTATQLVAGVAGKKIKVRSFQIDTAREIVKPIDISLQDDEATPVVLFLSQTLSGGEAR